MSSFAAAIEEALDAGTVRAEILLRFILDDEDFCVWTGTGDLYALGKTWLGAGSVGRLPEIEQLVNGQANRMTIEVSGVSADAIAALAEDAPSVEGKELEFYLCLFDERGQVIDQPQFLTVAIMDEVMSEQSVDGGQVMRKITLDVASPFAARSTAPLAYFTNQDQVARYPTDQGCDRVGFYQNRTIGWPVF